MVNQEDKQVSIMVLSLMALLCYCYQFFDLQNLFDHLYCNFISLKHSFVVAIIIIIIFIAIYV